MVLSVFPLLFSYSLLGILVLRLVLGLVFLRLGYNTVVKLGRTETWIRFTGWLMILIALSLIIGLATQLATLLAGLFSLLAILIKIRNGAALEHGLDYYLLIFAIAFALLFLGPGALAIDLPL